jgi:hypothetical protein
MPRRSRPTGDPPRWHAEERDRAHADTRGSVQVPGLRRLRTAVWIGCSRPERGNKWRRNPSRCREWWPATPRCAPSGLSGNDLHYRGYDILDIAERCEFEEIAYLLIHEKFPNARELAAYKAR